MRRAAVQLGVGSESVGGGGGRTFLRGWGRGCFLSSTKPLWLRNRLQAIVANGGGTRARFLAELPTSDLALVLSPPWTSLQDLPIVQRPRPIPKNGREYLRKESTCVSSGAMGRIYLEVVIIPKSAGKCPFIHH